MVGEDLSLVMAAMNTEHKAHWSLLTGSGDPKSWVEELKAIQGLYLPKEGLAFPTALHSTRAARTAFG